MYQKSMRCQFKVLLLFIGVPTSSFLWDHSPRNFQGEKLYITEVTYKPPEDKSSQFPNIWIWDENTTTISFHFNEAGISLADHPERCDSDKMEPKEEIKCQLLNMRNWDEESVKKFLHILKTADNQKILLKHLRDQSNEKNIQYGLPSLSGKELDLSEDQISKLRTSFKDSSLLFSIMNYLGRNYYHLTTMSTPEPSSTDSAYSGIYGIGKLKRELRYLCSLDVTDVYKVAQVLDEDKEKVNAFLLVFRDGGSSKLETATLKKLRASLDEPALACVMSYLGRPNYLATTVTPSPPDQSQQMKDDHVEKLVRKMLVKTVHMNDQQADTVMSFFGRERWPQFLNVLKGHTDVERKKRFKKMDPNSDLMYTILPNLSRNSALYLLDYLGLYWSYQSLLDQPTLPTVPTEPPKDIRHPRPPIDIHVDHVQATHVLEDVLSAVGVNSTRMASIIRGFGDHRISFMVKKLLRDFHPGKGPNKFHFDHTHKSSNYLENILSKLSPTIQDAVMSQILEKENITVNTDSVKPHRGHTATDHKDTNGTEIDTKNTKDTGHEKYKVHINGSGKKEIKFWRLICLFPLIQLFNT